MIDLVALPIANDLLECLRGEMKKVPRPPASVCLRPGTQVDPLISTKDDECCSGLAWVRIAQIFPSSGNFPQPDSDTLTNCQVLRWGVVLEMGAVRCAPTPNQRQIPTCEEWTAVVEDVANDAAAMRRAVVCCYGVDPDVEFLVGSWQPLQTEGRCAGGVMQVTVAADPYDCCPQEES